MLNAYFPFGAANSLASGRAGCNRLPPRERQPRQAPPGLAAFSRLPACAHLDQSRMLVTEKLFGFLLAALAVRLVLNGLADLE